MRVENNNVSGQNHDPEQIDLIDLLVQLWRGKMTIIISVIVAIAPAIGYLAVAKEKWTSTAIVTQPDVGQIAGYNNAINVIYGSAAPKVSEIQSMLIGRFSTTFSALAETLDNQEEPEKLTIEPTVKNQSLPLAVSYVGETPEGAQKQLAKYIQQVDDQVNEELEKDLKDNIALRMKNLQDSLKTRGSGCAGAERSAYPSDSGSVAVCESGAGDKAADSADTGRNPRYYVPFGERSAGVDD